MLLIDHAAKVAEKIGIPGSGAFVQTVRATRPAHEDLSEIPLPQRRQPAKPLASYVRQCSDRDQAIALADRSVGYTLKEIGEHFSVHYSRVSRIVAMHQEGGSK